MRSLVVGASAGIGRALARALAARGHGLVLVARDERDLAAEAAHLKTVYGVAVAWRAVDAAAPAEVVAALAALDEGPPIDNLFFPLGMADDDDTVSLPAVDAARLVTVNLVSVMTVVAQFLPRLTAMNAGNIVGFGSIAAIRGRNGNVAYAAAKRGLESYFESLRHATAATGIKVQFYRLGYVDTQLAYGKALRLPKSSPEAIAERAADNLGRHLGRAHLPAYWAIIAPLVRHLPWALYRRLNF